MTMQQDKQANLERFHANVVWFDSHYDELLAKYPDQWVGICDEKVIGASPDLENLMVKMKANNQPLKHTFFDFLDSKQTIWAFAAGV